VRGVSPELRNLLAAVTILVTIGAIGCSSAPSDEGTVKPGNGVALNPGGKPQNADQAAYASQMQKTGDAMNAQREKDAEAMAAARARAGGK